MSTEVDIDPFNPDTYPRTIFFRDGEFRFCYANSLSRLLEGLPASTILDFSFPGFAVMSRDIEMASGVVRPRMYSGVIDLIAGEVYFFDGNCAKVEYGTPNAPHYDQVVGTIHERFYPMTSTRYVAEIRHRWARESATTTQETPGE